MKPKPPPICIETPLEIERRRRAALRGWVVGWKSIDLWLVDGGWLGLRPDAVVFRSWLHAFWASWLLPFVPIPFSGWPRRQLPPETT